MENKIRYIYYDVKLRTGANPKDKEIVNENILLIKPHTNSEGVWSFTNMTERKDSSGTSFSYVVQNWVDLDKFESQEEGIFNGMDKEVDIALKKIIKKLSENK